MSVNSTYSSPLHLRPPSFTWTFVSKMNCYMLYPDYVIFTTFTITNILLLLLFSILVLNRRLQQWQGKSTATMTSHLDMFTYHMIVAEFICALGNIICCCGVHLKDVMTFVVGYYLFSFTWYGATFFHVLTCLEHYLAVVHPIIYLGLRKERGVRIRNVTIGCIWLFCVVATSLGVIENFSLVMGFCFLVMAIIITCFCSLSVLCVLIRPGPGRRGSDGGRVDRTKLRAFCIITIILVVLFLRWAWSMIWGVLYLTDTDINQCTWTMSEIWINLPSSLVLPLLFLQRTRSLTCCNNIHRK